MVDRGDSSPLSTSGVAALDAGPLGGGATGADAVTSVADEEQQGATETLDSRLLLDALPPFRKRENNFRTR